MNSADGAILFAFRLLQNKNAPATRATKTTAPMTPPAMGPAFEEEDAARTVGIMLEVGDMSASVNVGVGLSAVVIGIRGVPVAFGDPVDESIGSVVVLGKSAALAITWQQGSIDKSGVSEDECEDNCTNIRQASVRAVEQSQPRFRQYWTSLLSS